MRALHAIDERHPGINNEYVFQCSFNPTFPAAGGAVHMWHGDCGGSGSAEGGWRSGSGHHLVARPDRLVCPDRSVVARQESSCGVDRGCADPRIVDRSTRDPVRVGQFQELEVT